MPDRVHEVYTEAVRRIAEDYSKHYGSYLHYLRSEAAADCDSTPKLLFMIAYHTVATLDGFHGRFLPDQAKVLYLSRRMRSDFGIPITSDSLLDDKECRTNIVPPHHMRLDSIYSRFDIEPYTADFVVTRMEYATADDSRDEVINVYHPVVVDCGGHDHYRTGEQVRDDKDRDRVLQMKGFQICRFTESDLMARPFFGASRVLELVGSRENLARRIPLKLPPEQPNTGDTATKE